MRGRAERQLIREAAADCMPTVQTGIAAFRAVVMWIGDAGAAFILRLVVLLDVV
jgi:hypothetical protein